MLLTAMTLSMHALPATGAMGEDPSTEEAPSTESESIMAEMARQAAAEWNVDPVAARARLDRQQEIAEATRSLGTEHAETYAGAWVDHHDGGRIKIAFTEEAVANAQTTAKGYEWSEMVDGVEARFAWHQLINLYDRVVKATARFNGNPSFAVSLDTPTNRVVIHTPEEIRDEVQKAVQPHEHPAMAMASGLPAQELDCTSRASCIPTLRGGLRINPQGSGSFCSSAFNAQNSSGTRYLLTAGHCAAVSSVWEHAANRIGGVPASINDANADAARMLVESTSVFNGSRWVYHTEVDKALQITTRAFVTDVFVGRFICRSGYTTGLVCGTVLETVTVGSSNGKFRYSACAAGGDSGGAVYDPNNGAGVAIGIHSASTVGNCLALESSVGSHIRNVETRLGVTVRTF